MLLLTDVSSRSGHEMHVNLRMHETNTQTSLSGSSKRHGPSCIISLPNLAVMSGEFCICKLIVSTYADQICANLSPVPSSFAIIASRSHEHANTNRTASIHVPIMYPARLPLTNLHFDLHFAQIGQHITFCNASCDQLGWNREPSCSIKCFCPSKVQG